MGRNNKIKKKKNSVILGVTLATIVSNIIQETNILLNEGDSVFENHTTPFENL